MNKRNSSKNITFFLCVSNIVDIDITDIIRWEINQYYSVNKYIIADITFCTNESNITNIDRLIQHLYLLVCINFIQKTLKYLIKTNNTYYYIFGDEKHNSTFEEKFSRCFNALYRITARNIFLKLVTKKCHVPCEILLHSSLHFASNSSMFSGVLGKIGIFN